MPRQKIDYSLPEWNERLRKIVKKCLAAGKVNRIIVFGSFALREMTDASDLDVLVVLPDEANLKTFREKLERPLSDWPLDLLVVDQSRFDARKNFGGVLFDANAEGIELYPEWKLL